MFEIIRRLKPAYAFYNLLHRGQLKHNIPAYKNLGLNKSYFSPVSSKDFSAVGEQKLSVAVDIKQLEKKSAFQNLSDENKQSVLDFDKNGFVILRKILDRKSVV